MKRQSPGPNTEQEKRAWRYRPSCPAKLQERLERAATQRLYLIERDALDAESTSCTFVVLGSTGNVYNVHLEETPSCNCPDFMKKQDLCKHILFVLLKVIGLSTCNPLAFQRAYLKSELTEMLSTLRHRRVGGINANARVLASYQKAHHPSSSASSEETSMVRRRSLEEDSDCPICFDPMMRLADTTFCQVACGANFHKDCIRHWFSQQRGSKTCPNCRQPWHDANSSSANSPSQEGYLNLGRLQGQSPVRDTSTYREFAGYKRPRYY